MSDNDFDIGLPGFTIEETFAANSRAGRVYSWGLDFLRIRGVQDKYSKGRGVIVFTLDTEDFPETIYLRYDKHYCRRFTNESDDVRSLAGHGVHVAETIQQIAPESVCGLVKGLTNGGRGSSSWIARAIRWVADMEVRPEHAGFHKVVNMSLGSPVASGAIEKAMEYAKRKGVIFVVAAGNGGNKVDFPGAYDVLSITVSAIDKDGSIASFSDRGPAIDVGAPGVAIFAEYKQRLAALSGTSMATPHVTGVLALILSYFEEISSAESFLKGGATDAGVPGEDDLFGAGVPIAPPYFDGVDPPPPPPPPPAKDVVVPTWLIVAVSVVVIAVILYFVLK